MGRVQACGGGSRKQGRRELVVAALAADGLELKKEQWKQMVRVKACGGGSRK